MKCHYVFEEGIGKVLIPGCWSVVMSNDIQDCTCTDDPASPNGFERKRYNEEIRKRNAIIDDLRKQVKYLHNELNRTIRLLEKNKK